MALSLTIYMNSMTRLMTHNLKAPLRRCNLPMITIQLNLPLVSTNGSQIDLNFSCSSSGHSTFSPGGSMDEHSSGLATQKLPNTLGSS